MRQDIDLDFFKEKLNEELLLVERELQEIGAKNPSNQSDWEAQGNSLDIDTADETEVADKMEELGNNTAVLSSLETKLKDIKDALEKIENDNYGICEISGEMIEEERLIANPAARTCKAHMN